MFTLIHFILVFYIFCKSNLVQGDKINSSRIEEGYEIAKPVSFNLFTMFESCAQSTMPHQKFIVDNVQSFINYPSKTTVGFGPKFTNNRKFFANMLSTSAFKEMLDNDEDAIRRGIIQKLQYCDQVVFNRGILTEFYDREVDQSKI